MLLKCVYFNCSIQKIWRKASPFDLEKRASSDALVDPWGGPGVAPRVPRDPWKSSPGEFDIFSSNSKSNDDLLAAPGLPNFANFSMFYVPYVNY